MKVVVKAKKAWSMFHRDIVRSAVLFAKDFYEIDEKVHVRLVGSNDETDGEMAKTDTKFIIWISPNDNLKTLLEVVFHEMTHVQQSREGWEMHDDDTVTWKGQRNHYDEDKHYWHAPWEKEAVRMGRKIRKLYMEKM